MLNQELYKKYDVPAPRYTSYPTVPYWSETPSKDDWLSSIDKSLKADTSAWSLYVHIPFCESFCTYCACNTSTTRDHGKEDEYIKALLTEWEIYRKQSRFLPERRLKQIHLGGGSPTFMSPENLTRLLKPIIDFSNCDLSILDASFEADPRTTTREHLEALYELGFSRISIGVQDFNEKVQRAVNRVQPRSVTERVLNDAREIGFKAVNFDLIYGLPKQDEAAIKHTVETTVELKPDRIALYSLAVVPWIKPAHKKFLEQEIPSGAKKRKLYEIAYNELTEAGYDSIGMDHFALKHDPLKQAQIHQTLHRNFMGYTEHRTDFLLGLGASAISDSGYCYHQNEKVLPVYLRKLAAGEIPTCRGHLLNEEDRDYKEIILSLMTRYQMPFSRKKAIPETLSNLEVLLGDGLVDLHDKELKVTEQGRPFLRNIAMAFDLRMLRAKPEASVFSQSV